MEPLEIEVKFPVADVFRLREKISGLGAVSRGRHFEINVRFDDGADSLRRRGCLLRLRRDRQATLTFKSRADAADSQFKIHKELEVQVSDFDLMERILCAAGFERRQVYEKWRETFSWNQTLLCLDEMPFGPYLEIEGPKAAIRRAASELQLNWNQRIRMTYLEMFSIIRERMQLPFMDITFDNFKNVRPDGEIAKFFK